VYNRKLCTGYWGTSIRYMWDSHHTASGSVLHNLVFNLWKVWCWSRFPQFHPTYQFSSADHYYNIAHYSELNNVTALNIQCINTTFVLKLSQAMPWLKRLVTSLSQRRSGYIIDQSMYDMWWTKWQRDRFFSHYFKHH
jgi:hypothetical protein